MKRSILLTFTLLVACTRTIYLPVESTSQTTSATVATRVDSIYCSDTVRIYTAGDTVYHRAVRTLRRETTLHDTVRIEHTDTIRIPVAAPSAPTSSPPCILTTYLPILLLLIIIPLILRRLRHHHATFSLFTTKSRKTFCSKNDIPAKNESPTTGDELS